MESKREEGRKEGMKGRRGEGRKKGSKVQKREKTETKRKKGREIRK